MQQLTFSVSLLALSLFSVAQSRTHSIDLTKAASAQGSGGGSEITQGPSSGAITQGPSSGGCTFTVKEGTRPPELQLELRLETSDPFTINPGQALVLPVVVRNIGRGPVVLPGDKSPVPPILPGKGALQAILEVRTVDAQGRCRYLAGASW